MNVTIYHNPRCSKSRQTLELLESKGLSPKIIEYLKTPPDPDTLRSLARQLGLPLAEILRRNESDFAEAEAQGALHDEALLSEWVAQHPAVLQRPIVVNEDSGVAVIGRPPDNVLAILES